MTPRSWAPLGLLALWLLLLLLSLLTRPLLPVDETRYVGVAWEMWRRGDFLVPYLNGAPYSDKPPLFFWLIHAGWWLFGVNEWWPRCVAALVSLAALWATANLAWRLWPRDAMTRQLVPWVLFRLHRLDGLLHLGAVRHAAGAVYRTRHDRSRGGGRG